ncbi:hypothetical protein [Vibrio parahaemolyticus]|uniref:hypothetical protein n=1 Tax=Vibrio parahaemolyticus TaxID=670 RepID=UPI0011233729|nr:hypothetical protein [Vibrio parahaemolyticus]TOI59241.1 hypothetical protein CGI55_24225 [Vibrio parahaemolyticus]
MEQFANLVSIVSGLMTIFGVTGIVSWSLTKEAGQNLSQSSMSIFAKSFKLALCVMSFLIFLVLLREVHFSLVLSIGKGWMPISIENQEFWWRESDWYAYIISYFINMLIGVPVYSLIVSSIYTWSFKPFRVFWKYLRNR